MLEHLVEFFGRTHLVVLHFPIALIIVAAMLELYAMLAPKLRRDAMTGAYRPSVFAVPLCSIALVAALVAVCTGLVFGYGGPAKVDSHRILGIVSAGLVLISCLVLLTARKPGSDIWARLYLGLLILAAVTVGITGHLGGELTHGRGFITRPLVRIFVAAPEPISALDPASFGISQRSLDTYLDTIQPIFDEFCIECHDADDPEDDVRLDALEFVLDPDLDMVQRGDADASELVYRIELPHGDPDLMPPPDDGEPLEAAQIRAIREWIEALGA
ncbi:MAG: hypothetical protein KC996_00290 [Phycisphaerales bacterium]|nr:hypothetical protein [Phycisphaerales bacterium]